MEHLNGTPNFLTYVPFIQSRTVYYLYINNNKSENVFKTRSEHEHTDPGIQIQGHS